MGLVAILFNGAKPFEQIVNTPSVDSPMGSLVKTSFREGFKNYTILYLYLVQGQGQIIPGGKCLKLPKKFYYFDHTLYVTAILLNDFSTFPPYKCMESQIWPCRKKVIGPPIKGKKWKFTCIKQAW